MEEKYGKWQPLRSLSAGGQGETFVALDTQRVNPEALANSIVDIVPRFAQILPAGQKLVHAEQLALALQRFAAKDDPSNLGALKVFHKWNDPDGYGKAKARMESEARAYEAVSHPNLLRLLDKDLTSGWIVTEYQPLGALDKHSTRYRGDLLGSLQALRPIVDAVAVLHRAGIVHRDIKPANVFLSARGDLILGDAGLVVFVDQQHSRVSSTFENVGSRDWMPAWAMGMRVDNVRPSFDVFSLGKLLWSLVSGLPVLQLWYLHEPPFELEAMFSDNWWDIKWARWVLDRCIVEKEKDCLTDAQDLLRYVDRAILALRRGAQLVGEGIPRLCTVCALGVYRTTEKEIFGFSGDIGDRAARVFVCDDCGHAQIFSMANGIPKAWQPKA